MNDQNIYRNKSNINPKNWKNIIDLIHDQVNATSREWSNEKTHLINKIVDLEKEVSQLKKSNNELHLKLNSNKDIPVNLNDKSKAQDELNINKQSKIKLQFSKQKINSDELIKNKYCNIFFNTMNFKKPYSFGGFEKIHENNKMTFDSVNSLNLISRGVKVKAKNLNENKNKKDTKYNITLFNNINLMNGTIENKESEIDITQKYIRDDSIKTVKNLNLNDSVNENSPFKIIDEPVPEDYNRNENACSFIYKPTTESNLTDRDLRISLLERNKQRKSLSIKSQIQPISILKSHLDSVRKAIVTDDMKYLVSVGEDMLIKIWDFKRACKNKEVFEANLSLRGHTKPIFSLANSIKNSTSFNNIYTGGSEGIIRFWKIPSVMDEDRYIDSEDLMKLSPCFPWKAHSDSIWELSNHNSLNILASVSSDGTCKIWKGVNEDQIDKLYYSYDSRSKNLLKQFSFKNHNYNLIEIPTSCSWSKNNSSQINISYIAPYIKIYDVESGKICCDLSYSVEKNSPYECQQTNKIIHHSFLNLLTTAHEDRQIRFFDNKTGKCFKSLFAHTEAVSTVSLGFGDYQLLSGSHDGSMRCWDLRKFKLLFDIPAHRKKNDEGCLSIFSHPGLKHIITSGADSLVKVFQSC